MIVYIPLWISHLVHFSFQVMKLSCNYFSLLKINNHQSHQERIIRINLPSTIVKPNDIAPAFLWLINTCTLFSWVCESHFLPLPPSHNLFLPTKWTREILLLGNYTHISHWSHAINKCITNNNSVKCVRLKADNINNWLRTLFYE